MIQLRDVSFTYAGSNQPTLRSVNLSFQPGERVLICGPSGCGKTTLALVMCGLLGKEKPQAYEGEIHVDGLDVSSTPPAILAKHVVLVTQNPELSFCTLTVRDELAFGQENLAVPPKEIEERSYAALRAVQAEALIDRWLDELSGGEQQKIAIAAALAMRPEALILDEPTSNLDPLAAASVADALEALSAAGATIIVIEHHPAALSEWAHRLITIEDGVVVSDKPFSMPASPRWPQAVQPVADAETLLESAGFSAGYGESWTLNMPAFNLRAGELLAVLGANGAGKSSLLLALAGLLKPKGGSILSWGNALESQALSQRARFIAAVFQNPDRQLFCQSVWEEAAYASRNFGFTEAWFTERVSTALRDWDLLDKRDQHPYRLSYGQKRRLNLAAVMPHAPRVLLLDEPFTGQDPTRCAALMEKICAFAHAGGAVVVATHDVEAAFACASRILFLENGMVQVDDVPWEAKRKLAEFGYNGWLQMHEVAA